MPDYFTLDELRAMPDMGDVTKFPAERCEDAAAHIVSIIEREVGTSFVPRTVTDEVHDGGKDAIFLHEPYTLSVVSATEDGVAVGDELSLRSGILRKLSGYAPVAWSAGFDNVSVTYVAGYSDEPPADVKEMALKGTRLHLLATASDSSANARRTSTSTDMGVENYVVAGQDRPTGYPEVDAMILGYKKRLHIAKVY